MAEQSVTSETRNVDRTILLEWGRLYKLCYQRPPKDQPIDAIVISTGDWTDRIHTALELWQRYAKLQKEAPLLVPSGWVSKRGWKIGNDPGEQFYNAKWMAKWFKSKGVPEGKILAEPNARNTKEMADFSLELIRNRGLRNIVLTVSPYFLPRAYLTLVASIISSEQPVQTKLYSLPSRDLPWQGYVPDEPKTRFEQIPVEVSKIHHYQTTGGVATEEQLRQYINWLKGRNSEK